MASVEMARYHGQLNGHESEQTPGDGVGQGNTGCCSPWGHKESDTTYPVELNNNDKCYFLYILPKIKKNIFFKKVDHRPRCKA